MRERSKAHWRIEIAVLLVAALVAPAAAQLDIRNLRTVYETQRTFGDWIVTYARSEGRLLGPTRASVAAQKATAAERASPRGLLRIACAENSAKLSVYLPGAKERYSAELMIDGAPAIPVNFRRETDSQAIVDESMVRRIGAALIGKRELVLVLNGRATSHRLQYRLLGFSQAFDMLRENCGW